MRKVPRLCRHRRLHQSATPFEHNPAGWSGPVGRRGALVLADVAVTLGTSGLPQAYVVVGTPPTFFVVAVPTTTNGAAGSVSWREDLGGDVVDRLDLAVVQVAA